MDTSQTGGSFDGPGSRPILGEAGPSAAAHTYMDRDSQQPYQHSHPLQHPHPHDLQRPQHHHYSHPSASYPYSQSFHGPGGSPTSGVSISPTGHHMQDPLRSSSTPVSANPTPDRVKRVGGKANVSSACGPCKRAHLACDVARPCKRCVNMGKEDQCEDVPHKKRGRPKVSKPNTEPYQRPARPAPTSASDDGTANANTNNTSNSNTTAAKWKGPSTYESPYVSNTSPPPMTTSAYASRPPSPPRTAGGSSEFTSTSALVPPPPLGGSSWAPSASPINQSGSQGMPELFTLFCTTELKILRATPASHSLTGYHPHEFVNLSLIDWLHPSDRHLIEAERARLVAVPYLSAHLHSNRETHAAVMQCSERELLSPAVGMREPYPNQNVRVLRADNGFSLFNVRLHLGGGLGGSLWQPETLGKIYLVVSCLLISDRDVPPDVSARRPAPVPPASAGSLPPPPGHALPSFSSIAAAADSPVATTGYYPSPASSRGQPYTYPRAIPAGSGTNASGVYSPQPGSAPIRRSSQSPPTSSGGHRSAPPPPPLAAGSGGSYTTAPAPAPPAQYAAGYYPDPTRSAPSGPVPVPGPGMYDSSRRGSSDGDEWGRRPGSHGHGHGAADSRRTWEL